MAAGAAAPLQPAYLAGRRRDVERGGVQPRRPAVVSAPSRSSPPRGARQGWVVPAETPSSEEDGPARPGGSPVDPSAVHTVSSTPMPSSDSTAPGTKLRFGRRNVLLLGCSRRLPVCRLRLVACRRDNRRGGAAGSGVLRPVSARDCALAELRQRAGEVLRRTGRRCDRCAGRSSGRIAQLVQSACLTRRMSGVRIPLRPSVPVGRYVRCIGCPATFSRGDR